MTGVKAALFSLLLAAVQVQAAWKSGGSGQFFYQQYSFAPTPEISNQNGGFSGNLKMDWSHRKTWKWKTDLDVKADALTKDSQEKFQWNPAQLYLEFRMKTLKMRGGFQTLVPEGPDFLNPADIIHSKNWRDPMAPTSLGSLGLSLSQEAGPFQWEIFYIPQQTKPQLPGPRNPWWPREKRLPIEADDLELRIPGGVAYEIESPTELREPLKNNYAFRLQSKSESFEGQVVFYEGLSQDPFLLTSLDVTLISQSPKTVLLLNSPIRLMPLYFKQRAAAGTFTVPFETWALKGGVNWIQPQKDDSRLPGESSTAVIGLEKNIETKKGLVTLILQHQRQQRQTKSQVSFLRSVFENSWSFGFRLPWGEETQFLGGVVHDSIGKSSLAKFGASHRLTEAWTADLEANLLQGPADTLLGLYDQYDRARLGFTYHW